MFWEAYPVGETVSIKELFSFFKIHHGKDYEFPGEAHNFWEMMYVIKGSLCVSADDKIYNLTSGEMIFHKPMELHKFCIDDDDGADIMVISYNAEGALTNFFENKVYRLNGKQKSVIDALMSYADSFSQSEETNYIKYIEYPDTSPLFLQTVAVYAQMLMLSLAQGGTVASVVKNADSKLFSKAVKFMNDNIYESPTAEDIARSLNVSVSTLKRIFAKYTGFGVHKYFLKLKLKCAIALLGEGDSVTGVSERLNFSSQGYFTRVFKRETGTLPSEYFKQ